MCCFRPIFEPEGIPCDVPQHTLATTHFDGARRCTLCPFSTHEMSYGIFRCRSETCSTSCEATFYIARCSETPLVRCRMQGDHSPIPENGHRQPRRLNLSEEDRAYVLENIDLSPAIIRHRLESRRTYLTLDQVQNLVYRLRAKSSSNFTSHLVIRGRPV